MCLWMALVAKAEHAREVRDDVAFDNAMRRLRDLPPHAVRPPEYYLRRYGLELSPICSTSNPICDYHRKKAMQ